jgi:hypothetical protein
LRRGSTSNRLFIVTAINFVSPILGLLFVGLLGAGHFGFDFLGLNHFSF